MSTWIIRAYLSQNIIVILFIFKIDRSQFTHLKIGLPPTFEGHSPLRFVVSAVSL